MEFYGDYQLSGMELVKVTEVQIRHLAEVQEADKCKGCFPERFRRK